MCKSCIHCWAYRRTQQARYMWLCARERQRHRWRQREEFVPKAEQKGMQQGRILKGGTGKQGCMVIIPSKERRKPWNPTKQEDFLHPTSIFRQTFLVFLLFLGSTFNSLVQNRPKEVQIVVLVDPVLSSLPLVYFKHICINQQMQLTHLILVQKQ